ncbi:UNVERIFIED_CONTAM: hypothetical protein GTU68_024833 [Idotea baltica]|nr:hypothetical protein [Idotea baltica]
MKKFQSFIRRNPTVGHKILKHVSKARAAVTEDCIRSWFGDLQQYMEEINALDVFNDPTRIFNCDKTNLKLCPNVTKVLGVRGWRNFYQIAPGQEKSTVTFHGTFNAAGDIVFPFLIFPYLQIPQTIVRSIPNGWVLGASESGRMKSGNFYEFMSNFFIPMIQEKKVKLPVILFVDGQSTHLTIETSKKCKENGVILYKLPPKTTHILHPADVGCFKPLKSYWRKVVNEWKKNNQGYLGEKDVAPLLEKVLNMIKRESIVNSFRACGLCPLDPNRPDYSTILDHHGNSSSVGLNDSNKTTESQFSKSDLRMALNIVEKLIPQRDLQQLKQLSPVPNQYVHLQQLWLKLKLGCMEDESQDLTAEQCDISISLNEESEIIDSSKEDDNVSFLQIDFPTPEEVVDQTSECNVATEEVPSASQEFNACRVVSKAARPYASKTQSNKRPTKVEDLPSSTIYQDHDFWPGKRTYKKRKALPSVFSVEQYKKYHKQMKENKYFKSFKRKQVSGNQCRVPTVH